MTDLKATITTQARAHGFDLVGGTSSDDFAADAFGKLAETERPLPSCAGAAPLTLPASGHESEFSVFSRFSFSFSVTRRVMSCLGLTYRRLARSMMRS